MQVLAGSGFPGLETGVISMKTLLSPRIVTIPVRTIDGNGGGASAGLVTGKMGRRANTFRTAIALYGFTVGLASIATAVRQMERTWTGMRAARLTQGS